MKRSRWMPVAALLLSSVAQAQSGAWSDASLLMPLAAQERDLGGRKAELCRPAAPEGPGPAVQGAGRDLDSEIRALEGVLRQLPRTDPRYRQVEDAIRQLRQLRHTLPNSPAVRPAAGELTLTQAFARIDARLERHSAAVAALTRSAEAQQVRAAERAAAAAVARRELDGALAAMKLAAVLDPKNPARLVNLAAVLNALEMPREAVAVLNAADRLKTRLPVVGGLPLAALALNNRGHALLLLADWKAAEPPLRQAVHQAPQLSEAHTNLSRALLCQGRLPEAARAFQAGMRRTPSARAGEDIVVKLSATDSTTVLAPRDEASVRRPARVLFDFSGAQDWHLPTFPFPRSVEEYVRLKPKYEAMETTWNAKEAAYQQREAQLDALTAQEMKSPLVSLRAQLIWKVLAGTDTEPEILPAYRSQRDAQLQYNNALARARRAHEQALADMPEDASECELLAWRRGVDQRLFDDVRSHFRGFEVELAKYASLRARHDTAIAANLPTRALRTASLDFIQHALQSMYYGQLWGSVEPFAFLIDTELYDQGMCGPTPPAFEVKEPAFPEFSIPDCPAGLEGEQFTLTRGPFGASLSCHGFEITATQPGPIGLFAKAGQEYRGTTTLIFGIQSSGEQEAGPVTASWAASEGIYLRWGQDGLEDVGLRIQGEGGLSAGTLGEALGLQEYKEGFEVEFGVASAVEYWTSAEYDAEADE